MSKYSMNINGKTFSGDCYGKGVSINNGKVIIDGNIINEIDASKIMKIVIEGDVGDVGSDKPIEIHGTVNGNVKSLENINCENIYGDVKAGHNVNCNNIEGDILVGKNVNCNNVSGNIRATGNVNKC